MFQSLKRLVIGRPIATADEGHQRLRKLIALPVFASDAISSTAYATDEILVVLLGVGGGTGLAKLGVGTTAGKTISSANYKIGAAASDANDYLIYNPATDRLYYDNDGNGAHAAVQVATITMSGTTAPAFSDFLLVV